MFTSFDLPAVGLLLVKGTVVLVAAILIAAALRRAAAGARYLVWLATLAAVLLFPALSRWSPWRLEVLPSQSPVASGQSPVFEATAVVPAEVSEALPPATGDRRPATDPPPDAAARRTLPSLVTTLGIVWAAVTGLLLLWLAAGALTVRHIVRGGRRLEDARWTTPLMEVADRLDLADIPELIASDRVEMPFACGVLRPTIVFPESAESWNDERRRVVLFHELAHIKRRDLVGHSVGRLACALYWFHPLVWTAARQLRNESERACDDLVLTCGARPSEYAAHLLDILTGARRPGAPATALPMARKREFEGRMLAILDPALRRGSAGRLQGAGVVATLALITLAVAAAAPATPVVVQVAAADSSEVIAHPSAMVPADEAVAETPAIDARVRPDPASANVAAEHQAPPPSSTASPSVSVRTSTRTEAKDESIAELLQSIEKQGKSKRSQAIDTAAMRRRIETLARVLRTDASEDVRTSAAWGLAHIDMPEIVPALMTALERDESEDVREMAAWGLSHRRGEPVRVALVKALKDPGEDVRETAAWGLAYHGNAASVAPLLGLLADESADVRQVALWALGHHRIKSAPKEMIDRLRDESDDVREAATWALTEIHDPASAPALLDAFRQETDSDVRVALFRAVAILGEGSPELIEEALKSDDAELRARAVRMLAGSGHGSWPWPWPWPRPRPQP